MQVALDETLSNVFTHALAGAAEGTRQVGLGVRRIGRRVELEVIDDGPGFDPTRALVDSAATRITERRPGGVGLLFVRAMTDETGFLRQDGHNRLVMAVPPARGELRRGRLNGDLGSGRGRVGGAARRRACEQRQCARTRKPAGGIGGEWLPVDRGGPVAAGAYDQCGLPYAAARREGGESGGRSRWCFAGCRHDAGTVRGWWLPRDVHGRRLAQRGDPSGGASAEGIGTRDSGERRRVFENRSYAFCQRSR